MNTNMKLKDFRSNCKIRKRNILDKRREINWKKNIW